jgi:hypothetical protein
LTERKDYKKKRFSIRRRSKPRLGEEDITVVDPDVAKRAVVATALGNAMEWFDFGIYSYLAVTIGKVFFPELTGSLQLIYAFATFAVAFLVRPLGGVIFGMLGDRWGRKRVLAITLILMGCVDPHRRWQSNRKFRRYWKSRKKPYGGGKKQIKMSHECCRIQLESVVIVLGRSGWGFTPPRFPSTRQIGANPEGSCVFCSGR